MLTEHERTQLTDQYRRTPLSAGGVLLTCAVGLLMVILLVLVGMDIHKYDHERSPAATAAQSR